MKKILATGGMLAYMLMFNSGVVSAHMLPDIAASEIQVPTTEESAKREKHFEAKISRLADKLGLDVDELKQDLESGQSTKDILKKYGVTKNQLREVMGNKRAHAHRGR